jgi:hypothetical protein
VKIKLKKLLIELKGKTEEERKGGITTIDNSMLKKNQKLLFVSKGGLVHSLSPHLIYFYFLSKVFFGEKNCQILIVSKKQSKLLKHLVCQEIIKLNHELSFNENIVDLSDLEVLLNGNERRKDF